ncbi:hypothetical protein [Demequina phytophila]|uniref:hypothetical protein n=1 Tax=Demequina phytophila TaxID=1638981 RepID=UPI00078453EB|nr:hypothetical protein [Demequina phytophila]
MAESLAASVRGLRIEAFEAHLARLETLTVRELVALSKARRLGLTEVFDVLADTDFLVGDWHPAWREAHETVRRVCAERGLDGLPIVCDAAADAAACQALARLFGSDVGIDIHVKLSEPWRFVMERGAR